MKVCLEKEVADIVLKYIRNKKLENLENCFILKINMNHSDV